MKKADGAARESYLKGFGGATVGGVIGFLMWVMTAQFVGGNLHLSFGFVLALFIYYGYFSMHGRRGKGFYAVFLPMVFLLGFLAAAVSFGIIHMKGLGFTGDNLPLYASAYYNGNLLLAYMDTLFSSTKQVFVQFNSLWPHFAIGVIYEAVGAMCYGVRAGKQMLLDAAQEKSCDDKEQADKEER